MKAVLLVLAAIAAVMVFTLPGKDAKIDRRIALCTRSLSAQNHPIMSKIDTAGFCGCVTHSFEDGKKASKPDIAVIRPCIDQYVQPAAKQICEAANTKTAKDHYDCKCYYDKLATVIMNHAEATRNHRAIPPAERMTEQNQFLQCKKDK